MMTVMPDRPTLDPLDVIMISRSSYRRDMEEQFRMGQLDALYRMQDQLATAIARETPTVARRDHQQEERTQ